MKLSIVIPAHNEEHRIVPMLDAYIGHFTARYGGEVELLVVVNGSTDGTVGVVRDLAERCPQVRLFVEPRRVGKGGAVMIGFEAARGGKIGFVDADGSTPPEAYQDLVDHIGGAGIVIASRWLPDSQVEPRQPLDRRIASRCFNGAVRFLFGLRITDTQCGAKLASRDAVLAVLPRLGTTRWAFDVDLLFQIKRAGFEIAERPTVWHDVAGSKLNVPRASVEMLLAIVRLRLLYSPFSFLVRWYNATLGRWLSHG